MNADGLGKHRVVANCIFNITANGEPNFYYNIRCCNANTDFVLCLMLVLVLGAGIIFGLLFLFCLLMSCCCFDLVLSRIEWWGSLSFLIS